MVNMIRHFKLLNKIFNPRSKRCYCFEKDEDIHVQEFISRELKLAKTGHQVLVIQPYIKWGTKKDRLTTPEMKLAESESLINTLRHWKVVDSMKIGMTSYIKHTFFGPGNIDNISLKIKQDHRISAVFISTNILKPIQHKHLENYFKVPVYDRYLIVIQIFREHAITREAKLQVALAEVPYVWSRIRGLQENYTERLGSEAGQIALSSKMLFDDKKDLLKEYEKKLKKMITKLRNHREHLRNSRKNKNLPVVAVVGYTNTGKTSLVKALTEDSEMLPRDCLFATLDVTVHGGILPSNLKVLYIDTIGFISDIPTKLIEPFVATLEDAMFADIIVHVIDVSHPNVDVQKSHVETTLKNLNVDTNLLNSIINVGNKIDLVENYHKDENCSYVSCVKGTGIQELKKKIEQEIIKATDRQILKIRVRTGQREYEWLRSHTAIAQVETDGDYSIFKVIATKSDLDVFKHIFIYKNSRKITEL